jgi:uncharacterized membrane protein (UPF0127 family)
MPGPSRPTPAPRRASCLPARVAARMLLAVAATTAVLAPVAAPAQGPADRPAPNPTLPIVEIRAGLHVVRAEVAADGPTRMRGLMMRERLGPNEGMLFVFEQKAGHCFWMRNTLIPLSIAFVEDDGTIVNIADMQPHSEQSHCPVRPVRYALEMEQGWFARKGLKPGSVLSQARLFGSASRP